jgi:hypothetical protein
MKRVETKLNDDLIVQIEATGKSVYQFCRKPLS